MENALEQYSATLDAFLQAQSERALYDASQLARVFIERGLGPEEIVAFHTEACDRILRTLPPIERARQIGLSFQFMIEIMIAYGVGYKEYLDLRTRERTSAADRETETLRARTEERIQLQRQAIEERETLLSFIAHELRNPLTILVGNVDYLLTGRRASDPDRQARIFANLKSAATRMQNLVTNLLAISRMQREGARPQAMLSVAQVLQDAVDEIILQATDRRIDLDVDLPEETLQVSGDETALVRLFSNLLENAVKYTPMGGRVWVKVALRDSMVCVDVGDTGQGIPPEEVPELFNLYYRARSSATPFAKGAGLGLALAKTIVDRHGGVIRVESEVGKGTVFTTLLPFAHA
jgi:signal transduction histidine kinase